MRRLPRCSQRTARGRTMLCKLGNVPGLEVTDLPTKGIASWGVISGPGHCPMARLLDKFSHADMPRFLDWRGDGEEREQQAS